MRSDFDHSNLFKAKKQRIVKIPPVGVEVKFCREDNFFTRWWKFKVRGQLIEYNRSFFVFKNFVENDAESFTRPVLRFK